ncbi:GNAT family N-acetyltransferase [Chungangia koreensis]|uniref:GNAT family N-acetyltransferase n=1 Tax=Chungangia koreensis TaxID=752657 RepID=A0ABV8X414_9LACT
MGIKIIEFPVLETERLRLRKVTEQDAPYLMEYLSDDEVMKHYGLEPFESIEEAISEIQWYDSLLEEQTGIRWGISLKDDEQIIGSVGFHRYVHQHHRVEIGFELSKAYWGKGIAGEALSAILTYGFETFPIQRIEALIEPENLASQKLVEKHGFIREGLLRKYEYTRGKYDDLYMYSLLKDDVGGN